MWSLPGTSAWPTMCARSLGMPYRSHRYRVRAADDRYIESVNQLGSLIKPSCSIPRLEELAERAWYAVSLSRTIWVIAPSEERTT